MTGDLHRATLRSLVDLAVASDDPSRLVAAAGTATGRPFGLVDPDGRALACVPRTDTGQRAVAVARAAARNSVVPPPGWQVSEIAHRSSRLGVLAVGANGPTDEETAGLLGALPTLLADQLRRAGLVRLHRANFAGRLVSDPPLAAHQARREAAELGLRLAEAYRPGVLVSRPAAAAPELESIEREAQRLGERTLTAIRDGRLVLLYPEQHGAASGAAAWFERVVRRARELTPWARHRVIAAESAVEVSRLSHEVATLSALGRFGGRSDRDGLVTWAREYALYGLLCEAVPAGVATSFVQEQVGALLDWDRGNHSDLAGVLEAALDFPRQDEASRRCFMHRNTFRHRLRRATEVLGCRLDNPDVRLAVHVALKLRHVLAAPPASGAEPTAGARAASRRHTSRDARRSRS